MVFIKKIIILFLIIILSSCAKMQYVFDQGIGQLSLNNKGIKNEKVLQDPRVKKEYKEKIEKIINFKKYFYNFYGLKETGIYSKTAILDRDAVIYLVIASRFDEINAKEFSFPFVGSFPYLGFFDKGKAEKFAKDLEKEEDLITYVRPVYAYSTLGHFEDNILSSFFMFQEYDLAELIFHELFHTIFFIKDEVELNENLANFFSREMLLNYYKMSTPEKNKYFEEKEKENSLTLKMVELINQFSEDLKVKNPKTREESLSILNDFLKATFFVEIKKKCLSLKIEDINCYPLNRDHNQASFSQFLTYESKSFQIEKLYKKLNLNLGDFLNFIKKKYQEYQELDDKKSFADFLFSFS